MEGWLSPTMERAMSRLIPRFTSERGATSIEYAIMASLVAGVIIFTVWAIGEQLADLFTRVIGTFAVG